MTAAVTDTWVLNELDFEYEPPCENRAGHRDGHFPPAELVIAVMPCPCSGEGGEYLICKNCWVEAKRRGLYCQGCLTVWDRDDAWRIVREIR